MELPGAEPAQLILLIHPKRMFELTSSVAGSGKREARRVGGGWNRTRVQILAAAEKAGLRSKGR